MAVYKSLKLLTGTAIALCLSAIAIAPASAQRTMQNSTPSGMEERQGDMQNRQDGMGMQEDSMQSGQIEFGRVTNVASTASSTRVAVEMENGTTRILNLSNADTLRAGQPSEISSGDYLAIRNDTVIAVAERGTIKSMQGSRAEVELENGGTREIEIPEADRTNANLTAGSQVYVMDDEIISSPMMTSQGSTDTTSPGSTTTPGSGSTYQEEGTTSPDSTTTPGSTSPDSTTTPGSTNQQGGTYYQDSTTTPGSTNQQEQGGSSYQEGTTSPDQESQPNQQDTEEPVRGMW